MNKINIAAVITGPTLSDAKRQIEKAKGASLLELRLDLFDNWSPKTIHPLIKKHRVILTWKGDPQVFDQLIALNPSYIDVDRKDLKHVLQRFPSERIIASYHNFDETLFPEPIEGVIEKVAVMPKTFTDVIALLNWCGKRKNRIGVSLGEKGAVSRILSPRFSSLWTYAPIEGQSAPGQIPFEEMVHTNKETELFGLIGDPVFQSIGHTFHNKRFREEKKNAFYIKIPVTKEELAEAFTFLKTMGFKGLSVTMPLKEAIIALLDLVDTSCGAVNTVCLRGKSIGTNTDGVGALDAIEAHTSVKGKTVLLLGAGGAARAFAFEAKRRGAHLFIDRNSSRKAEAFGKEFESEVVSDIKYDILVNTTPVDPKVKVLPNTYIMDMRVTPQWTRLLIEAKDLGATPIFGKEMFFKQAEKQSALFLQ